MPPYPGTVGKGLSALISLTSLVASAGALRFISVIPREMGEGLTQFNFFRLTGVRS